MPSGSVPRSEFPKYPAPAMRPESTAAEPWRFWQAGLGARLEGGVQDGVGGVEDIGDVAVDGGPFWSGEALSSRHFELHC